METPNLAPYDHARIVSGIKTAALIVIIGAVAVIADHALFVAPDSPPQAQAVSSAAPAVPAAAPAEGFAFADPLRPTEADREPPPPSF